MSAPPRDQALSLLAAANNHGDLAVKLSSLRQARDILLSADPSLASDLFPYLADLHTSPESLVRISLIQAMEEIGLKAMDRSCLLMPVLLELLKDGDPIVARQSIVSGTNFFCSVLEELTLQFHRRGNVERWLQELWMWMVRFKDVVFAIALEPGSVSLKLMAFKFLETHILLFTSHTNNSEKSTIIEGSRQTFNVSWLVGGHPVLDPLMLMSEANRTLGILLDLLHSAGSLPGSLIISIVNCLAAVARKRPIHYSTVLSALLDFDPNFEVVKGGHGPSIRYCFRTAFLGFLRCTHPSIIESKDRLHRVLRAMNAGDAADQVLRQVDKMMKQAERASRDARLGKDDQLANQAPFSGDMFKKRSMVNDYEDPINSYEVASKRVRHSTNAHSSLPVQTNDSALDFVSANGLTPNSTLMDVDLTPVEQMIAMIGALLAEGERGADSLEILISKVQPDLLADIVITNMKHLPKAPPPFTRPGNLPVNQQIGSLGNSGQAVATSPPTVPMQSPVFPAQIPSSSITTTSTVLSDTFTVSNLPADSKRDPRRDPRRLDPRRVAAPSEVPSVPASEIGGSMQSDFDNSNALIKPPPVPIGASVENSLEFMTSQSKIDDDILESPLVFGTGQLAPKEDVPDGPVQRDERLPIPGVDATSDPALSFAWKVDQDSVAPDFSDVAATIADETLSSLEVEEHSPSVSNASASEEICLDLPQLPLYVEIPEEEQRNVRNLAVERIIVSYKHLQGTSCSLTRMALLARLVVQADADDDVVTMLQKHIVVDYQEQKGHELVLQILYHLRSLMVADQNENSSLAAAAAYEKFLLTVAKSLLDNFPASDKSFSRLLGEVPHLPESAFKILEDLCYADVIDQSGRVVRDVERVTQGLGAVWSLILGRPCNRQACLSIALKCAIHSQDEIRAKAIRLVANKLYLLSYILENVELFATNMLLSAVDRPASNTELSQSESSELRAEGQIGNQETSVSGSQVSEPGTSENNSSSVQVTHQSVSTMSISEAQRLISLFFALCTKKKPSLLRLVFDIYGRGPKTVKQAIHRHIPILIRALGSSHSELLRIVSDPPQGTENLLMAVLQVLTQEATPSPDLIATVKHLYETKLKDATILIPMLSSLSKDEVLPIFPRLVNLPLDKFQTALAHILQGSAHTGPALTPAEVLVAIHDIRPEKDGLPLKKITDACSACFEQRTVFTQQVLAKALNQMVDQTPLPLLFMRSVIQAIDAFPALVDFVMEILSKLVSRQVWKMPKLWVGFLKCVSQTQPHSFRVFLQLPPPQLESALNRHANLRGSLAAYASQPSIRASLPRSTLAVLGVANDTQTQQSHLPPLHPPDTSSSVHGTTLT